MSSADMADMDGNAFEAEIRIAISHYDQTSYTLDREGKLQAWAVIQQSSYTWLRFLLAQLDRAREKSGI